MGAVLEGKRAIVTGGASGIGRAACRRMAAEGATVAVFDLDGEAAAVVAKEVGGISAQVDVADRRALEAAVRDAAASMGGLEIMFNNAGMGFFGPMHEYGSDLWERIVGVNLTGVFNGISAAGPLIRDGGGGAIVNTASVSGVRPAAGEAPYAAAKAGIVALTAVAALEYAPTVRVNAVSPGMILTQLTQPLTAFPDRMDAFVDKTPLGRIGEPEDIADVVVFLCSEDARFMTGQNLVVDGGMLLHGSGVDGLFEYFMAFRQGEGS